MRRRTLLATATALAAPRLARAAPPVDVALVLAADVSRSMDETEQLLQRDGYVAALAEPAIHQAIAAGEHGAIGLCYLEWSGPEDQRVIVPWQRVGSATAAASFIAALRRAPLAPGTWTSISAALGTAQRLLAQAPFPAARQVVDVSGDGQNNIGLAAETARDAAVAAGITINGLPVLRADAPGGNEPLDEYYRRAVMGGDGAFVLPAADYADLARAIRRKLVLEIAGLRPHDTA